MCSSWAASRQQDLLHKSQTHWLHLIRQQTGVAAGQTGSWAHEGPTHTRACPSKQSLPSNNPHHDMDRDIMHSPPPEEPCPPPPSLLVCGTCRVQLDEVSILLVCLKCPTDLICSTALSG